MNGPNSLASSIEVVTFAPEQSVPPLFATVVRVEKKRVVVALASRKEMVLDLRRPNCFDVASLRQIEVTRRQDTKRLNRST
jgi:hypothetical protein